MYVPVFPTISPFCVTNYVLKTENRSQNASGIPSIPSPKHFQLCWKSRAKTTRTIRRKIACLSASGGYLESKANGRDKDGDSWRNIPERSEIQLNWMTQRSSSYISQGNWVGAILGRICLRNMRFVIRRYRSQMARYIPLELKYSCCREKYPLKIIEKG